MSSEPDTLSLLKRAVDQTTRIIAAVTPGQASMPTPCSDWDVRALIAHLAGQDLRNFIVAARGEMADWQAPPDDIGENWEAAFSSKAELLLAEWQAADLDRPVATIGGQAPLRSRASQQVAELAVHGWDLVKATGQRGDLDPRLAEHALNWSHEVLRPEQRGSGQAFGAEVSVPLDAPAYERLAGWFGRDPRWSPSPS